MCSNEREKENAGRQAGRDCLLGGCIGVIGRSFDYLFFDRESAGLIKNAPGWEYTHVFQLGCTPIIPGECRTF